MKEITFDCRGFASPADLHSAFALSLSFPDHYGSNLDALHDCLTDLSGDIRICLVNWEDAESRLGKYAHNARRTILDAAVHNPGLTVLFD